MTIFQNDEQTKKKCAHRSFNSFYVSGFFVVVVQMNVSLNCDAFVLFLRNEIDFGFFSVKKKKQSCVSSKRPNDNTLTLR